MGCNLILACGLLSFGSAQSVAQEQNDYIGAKAVLREIQVTPSGSAPADAKAVFADAVATFGNRVIGMDPKQAADEWLVLCQRAISLTDESQYRNDGYVAAVLEAIPSPASWPYIERELSGNAIKSPARSYVLYLLIDVLQGNYRSALTRLKALEPSLREPDAALMLNEVRLNIAIRRHDPDAIESELRIKANLQSADPGFLSTFEVPDLVRLLGRERARKVLTYILTTAKSELMFHFGEPLSGEAVETRDLARQIAIEHPERVPWPQWTIASSLDAGDLFEAFLKKAAHFHVVVPMSVAGQFATRDNAALHRLVALFLNGDFAKARDFATSDLYSLNSPFGGADDSIGCALLKKGKMSSFLEFLSELAIAHPYTELIRTYLSYAREYEQLPRLEAFLKRAVKESAPGSLCHSLAERNLPDVYLREGKWQDLGPNPEAGLENEYIGYDSNTKAALLVDLGRELNRPELVDKGVALAETGLGEWASLPRGRLLATLMERGQGPQIEKALTDRLKRQNGGSSFDEQDKALDLAEFYLSVGRYQDVVTLFEEFPNWRSDDLADISGRWKAKTPLYMAAYSLAKLGRKDEALRALRYEMRNAPVEDDDYALLLDVAPAQAVGFLDQLSERFPVAPRPYIWKAKLLLDQGLPAQAEVAVRHAIALDPNDLAAWASPNRFMAYSVLAQIERAKGHAEDAKVLETYRECARLADEADSYDEHMLYRRAISLYLQELLSMPTDFRSRFQLGCDLMEIGEEKEGAEQIQAACHEIPPKMWTSMRYWYRIDAPTGAFEASEVALESEIKHGTPNAGIYTILGVILERKSDKSGAARSFERAVSLDPDDLFAWNELRSLPASESDLQGNRIAANLFRLGGGNPFYSANQIISDYGADWQANALAIKRQIDVPKPVFNLRASRDWLAKTTDSNLLEDRIRNPWPSEGGPPGGLMAKDSLLQSILALLTRTTS